MKINKQLCYLGLNVCCSLLPVMISLSILIPFANYELEETFCHIVDREVNTKDCRISINNGTMFSAQECRPIKYMVRSDICDITFYLISDSWYDGDQICYVNCDRDDLIAFTTDTKFPNTGLFLAVLIPSGMIVIYNIGCMWGMNCYFSYRNQYYHFGFKPEKDIEKNIEKRVQTSLNGTSRQTQRSKKIQRSKQIQRSKKHNENKEQTTPGA